MNDEIIKNLAQSYANANVRIEQLERENAELREDKEILDWLEETLVSLHTMSTPDMSGARISGQLRNKLRDDSGAAGPSYIRIFHPTIRAAVNAARAKGTKS